MTRQSNAPQEGKNSLLIAIVGFVAVLVVLLITAGLGNATQSPEARLPVNVSTSVIALQKGFKTPISIYGLIESPKTTSLSFDIAGRVNEIFVEEGERVNEGQILAHLDIERLRAKKQELEASLSRADADLALAKVNNERTISLVQRKLESSQRLDETEAALNIAKAQRSQIQASLHSMDVEISKATLKAPFDGVVTRRFVDEGSVTNSGVPVLGVTGVDAFHARFAVPADVIEQFSMGQVVDVQVGQRRIQGTVTQRLPIRNVQTRTIDILVTLKNNEGVRPGDMGLLTGERVHNEAGAWLPVNALSNGLRGLWRVFVIANNQQPKLEARVVEVIYTDGKDAFVRGAIKNGETFVNEGTHKLAPGQVVSLSSQRESGAM